MKNPEHTSCNDDSVSNIDEAERFFQRPSEAAAAPL